MDDGIEKIIAEILSDHKIADNPNFSEKVYSDEPILHTAAQMRGYMPPKYREMKNITAPTDAWQYGGEKLFYKQAKFMEDFTDDAASSAAFFRYFPSYQCMNDRQLRTYFTWRTKVRRGEIEKTSASYVFVYLYELLNLIGVKSPEEGYYAIRDFWNRYRELDRCAEPYVRRWLIDFVVYYNLDRSLLENNEDLSYDAAVITLREYKSRTQEELFSALLLLSSYRLDHSRLYKAYPDEVRQVVCAVFVAMTEYYAANRKRNICERLFGKVQSFPCYLFGSAVFYDRKKYKAYTYTLSPLCRYTCRDGRWRCESLTEARKKSKQLGAMLKTIDRLMREYFGFKPPLKEEKTTRLLTGFIEKELAVLAKKKQEEKRAAAPKIEIDLSKLQDIRRAAAETRDKLIVEETPEDAVFALSDKPAEQQTAPPVAAVREADETGLTETEYRLMRCFLYGGDTAALLRESGAMLSVLVDAVNEKLFDRFGDTVLLYDGDTPELIADYTEELKGIIAP